MYTFECELQYGPVGSWSRREYKLEIVLQCHASEILNSLENKLNLHIENLNSINTRVDSSYKSKSSSQGLDILDFDISLFQEIEVGPEPLPKVITVEVAVPDSKVIEIEKIVYLKESKPQEIIDEDYVNALVEVALEQKLLQNKIKSNKVPQAQ